VVEVKARNTCQLRAKLSRNKRVELESTVGMVPTNWKIFTLIDSSSLLLLLFC